MSKAYCCDRCRECYTGAPEMTLYNRYDLCPNCVRFMKLFSLTDPFDVIYSYDREGDQ